MALPVCRGKMSRMKQIQDTKKYGVEHCECWVKGAISCGRLIHTNANTNVIWRTMNNSFQRYKHRDCKAKGSFKMVRNYFIIVACTQFYQFQICIINQMYWLLESFCLNIKTIQHFHRQIVYSVPNQQLISLSSVWAPLRGFNHAVGVHDKTTPLCQCQSHL